MVLALFNVGRDLVTTVIVDEKTKAAEAASLVERSV